MKKTNLYLIGNPNVGKSSIFNKLTGLKQSVGNFAGTTVEKKIGKVTIGEENYQIIDLPGTYSIFGNTEDEKITTKQIINTEQETDIFLYVADANSLFRNLLLFSQICNYGVPIVLIINQWDTINEQNIKFSVDELSSQLGIEVIAFSTKSKSIKAIEQAILNTKKEKKTCEYFNNLKQPNLNIENRKIAANYTLDCYQSVGKLMQNNEVTQSKKFTEMADKILMHPLWGLIIFVGVLFILFQTLFSLSSFPMDAIENFFNTLSIATSDFLPKNSLWSKLIIKGIIPGLSGVFVFTPIIALLYILLSGLEETGYMSRVSFLLDGLMRKIGLNGKSIIPMVGGFACAIPAMMSARTISNKKDRLITLLITPLMSCSARLPVYTILISLLALKSTYLASYQTLIFLVLYLSGILFAIIVALIFKSILPADKSGFFILEMPQYKKPSIRNIMQTTVNKTVEFLKKAGIIIFIVSIGLWVLTNFGPPKKMAAIESSFPLNNEEINPKKDSTILSNSYAAILGKKIEPVIKPIGYDWKIGIAIIASFAAREVFVGSLSTIYASQSSSDNHQVLHKLKNATSENGLPTFSIATICSLLVFYMFALQCFSTIAVMRRESGKIKWALIQFLYLGVLAYGSAFLVYQLLK